jgi:hypothetical protein
MSDESDQKQKENTKQIEVPLEQEEVHYMQVVPTGLCMVIEI